jgi:hypothetical protein
MLPSFFFEAYRLRKVPLVESLRIIGRGSLNWLAERPIVVSFEVTDACTCWCKHCDHGGPRDESRNLKPAEYRRYMEALRPCVVQVSGGEPLMRDDVVEIVRKIKGGVQAAVHHPGFQLVAHDRGEVPGAAPRPASTSSPSAWISPTSATTISASIRASTAISKT